MEPSNLPHRRGFTLIELLIVISILGVLAAVLLPQLMETKQTASEVSTTANMEMLETGVAAFARKHGIMPPDDLKVPDTVMKVTWKADNGRNTGIESLVCFLSQSSQDGIDLSSLSDQFTNTDGDDHGVEMPRLKKKERVEIADHFGTPMVYFSKFGMERPQQVQPTPEGDVVTVKAARRADGVFYGAGKFQLLSAGKDGIFGNGDDLVWPKN